MRRLRIVIILCGISFLFLLHNLSRICPVKTSTADKLPETSNLTENVSQHHIRREFKDVGIFQSYCTEAQCLWLHTAYNDPRSSRLVRVIVIGDGTWLSVSLYCHFHFVSRKGTSSNTSIIVPHMNPNSVNINGYTIKCVYPPGSVPDAISLSTLSNQTNGPIVPLIRIPALQQRPGAISACLAPLHGFTSEKVNILIEWFEYYQLLGVSHFVAYNWSATDALVTRVLDHYIKKGVLELIPWRPPVTTDPFGPWPPKREVLHYFGQMTADTDCMYRLMNQFQWLLYCDLDEYLVPRKSKDLPSLVSGLYREGKILLFRTADFDRSLGLSPIGKGGLLALNYTKHLGANQPHYRSKIIIDPSIRGESMGVHKLFFLCPKSVDRVCFYASDGYTIVPPEVATMHHYRFIRDPKEQGTFLKDRKIVRDDSMAQFADHLIRRVKGMRDHLKLL